MFPGALQPDITFFGFDFRTDRGDRRRRSAGYYMVIQEHPTEPRFGLDTGTRRSRTRATSRRRRARRPG